MKNENTKPEVLPEHECGDCGWTGTPTIELEEIPDLWQRLDAGSTVPSGECPECGALCYLIEVPNRIIVEVQGGVVTCVHSTDRDLHVYVHDWDDYEEEDVDDREEMPNTDDMKVVY